MSETAARNLVALVPPLLRALEALGFVARHFHPPEFGAVLEAVGTPDEELRADRELVESWPDELIDVAKLLSGASDAALAAFEGLRTAPAEADGVRAAF